MPRTSSALHVLITADAVGGVWSYVYELCRALPDVRFTIANMGPLPSATQQKAACDLKNVELVCREYRLEWMEAPWDDVDRAGAWLCDLARECAADVVHLNGYSHAVLDFAAPVVVTAHSCVQTWWRAVHGTQAPPGWNEYKRRVHEGLRVARLVIVPTRAFLLQLEDVYGALPHARVVYNGHAAAANEALGKEPLVLAVGRLWDEAKNIQVLAGAAAQLPWPIMVAGSALAPDGTQAAPNSLRSLGVLDREELFAWLRRTSVFVSPALYEPFGYGALEAALQGCALVLSDIETFHEVWGDAALYVPPKDSAAIQRVLAELIAAPARLTTMSRSARERAERYSSTRMAHAYLAAYRELTNAQSPHLVNA